MDQRGFNLYQIWIEMGLIWVRHRSVLNQPWFAPEVNRNIYDRLRLSLLNQAMECPRQRPAPHRGLTPKTQ